MVSVLGYHSDVGSSNPGEVDCENLPYKGSMKTQRENVLCVSFEEQLLYNGGDSSCHCLDHVMGG